LAKSTWPPDWKGTFGLNKFTSRVVIRRIPPWGFEEIGTPWDDSLYTAARIWFQREARLSIPLGDFGRAVWRAASYTSFHPVIDYFNSLEWDGTERAPTFLPVYFKTEDNAYTRAVGLRWLLSSVARIMQPGCKADNILIAEGPQDLYKSAGFAALVKDPDWYTDRLSAISSKDAAMECAGLQIMELAELVALLQMGTSAGSKKAFVTRQSDRFRPPYGRDVINLRRQLVFCGTHNPYTVDGRLEGYLDDPTGGRRYWPVMCLSIVDYQGIERIRDQLWAELFHRYDAGERWWIDNKLDPELVALAKIEQDKRFKAHKYEAPIRDYLEDATRTDTSQEEILRDVFGKIGKGHQSDKIIIASILNNRLGYERYHPGHKTREWRYRKILESVKNVDSGNWYGRDEAPDQPYQSPDQTRKPTSAIPESGKKTTMKTKTKAKAKPKEGKDTCS
jgi:predicted P-loop ATPase